MERLTGWDESDAYFTECFEEPCLGSGCVNDNCEFMELVCNHLAEYEDLGVTPEQVREIDKLYTEKCREVAELRARYEKTFERLEELDDQNRELQRYKWIPVEERLPEYSSYYHDRYDDKEYVVTVRGASESTILYFSKDGSWYDDDGDFYNAYNVSAWMEKPEPYKEGE